MTEQNDDTASDSSAPTAVGTDRRSAEETLREAVRSSRPVRHVIRWIGVLGLVAVAGIGAYYAGRVRGFDEGRAVAIAATSSAVQAGASKPSPGAESAAPQLSPNVEPIIPASELADLYDPPNPATLTAVVARAHMLCHTKGTDDRPLNIPELVEMASGQIAAFDAVAKHGGKLTPESKRCYREAEALLEEDRKNQAEPEQP